jgi:hypothetical protein
MRLSITTGDPIEVSEVRLRLEINAGPVLSVRLNPSTLTLDQLQSSVMASSTGTVEFDNGDITFQIIGYQTVIPNQSDPDSTLEIAGLVLKPELVQWFESRPYSGDAYDTLIYQWQSDASAWLFLRRILGYKIAQPTWSSQFDGVLQRDACILRGATWSNFRAVNNVVSTLSDRLPGIVGWIAFNRDEDPLALVLADQLDPLQLGERWRSVQRGLPSQYGGRDWSDISCWLAAQFSIAEPAAFFNSIASRGSPGRSEEIGGAQCADQLILMPGAVQIGERVGFCSGVIYSITAADLTNRPLAVTARAEIIAIDRASKAAVHYPRWLVGNFETWAEAPEGTPRDRVGLNAAGQRWVLMAEGHKREEIDERNRLHACVLVPSGPRENYGGFYVRHAKNDPMLFSLHDGNVPLILGAVQHYAEELEKTDLTLNAERIVLTSSTKDKRIEDAESVFLDGSAGLITLQSAEKANYFKLGHDAGEISVTVQEKVSISAGDDGRAVVSSDQVSLMNNVQVYSDKMFVSGDAKIGRELKVGSG